MPSTAAPSTVYRWGGRLYVNLTNRCPTSCAFCVKKAWGMAYRGHDLRLESEPAVEDVLREIDLAAPHDEVVFCGYGEPTMRIEAVRELGLVLRRRGLRVRLNTVGLGSAVHGRDIVPELKGALDSVSVSLNTADPQQWRRLHRPAGPCRRGGYAAVLDFLRSSVSILPKTIVTAVELPGVDLRRVEILASTLGAEFRLRPKLKTDRED